MIINYPIIWNNLMKFILLFLILSFQNVFAQLEFEKQNLSTNYNKILCFQDNILLFGTNNVITYSNDEGMSWQLFNTSPESNFNNILWFNNEIIGISQNSLYKSNTKNLNLWTEINLDNENNQEIINAIVDENFLYILFANQISLYDANYILVANLIFPSEIQFFPLNLIVVKDELLIFSAKSILHISKSLIGEFEIITPSYNFDCNDCSFNSELELVNDTLIISFASRRYGLLTLFSSDLGQNLFYIGQTPNSFQIYSFNNIIFTSATEYLMPFIYFTLRDEGNFVDSIRNTFIGQNLYLELNRHTADNFEGEPIFERFYLNNNLKLNNYSIKKVNSNLLILYGDYNLIMKSNDGGATWDVVSNLYLDASAPSSLLFAQNTHLLFINDEGYSFHSNDKGITFKAQRQKQTNLVTQGHQLIGVSGNLNDYLSLYMHSIFNLNSLVKKIDTEDKSYSFEETDHLKGIGIFSLKPQLLNFGNESMMQYRKNIGSVANVKHKEHLLYFNENNELVNSIEFDDIIFSYISRNSNDTLLAFVSVDSRLELWLSSNRGKDWEILDTLETQSNLTTVSCVLENSIVYYNAKVNLSEHLFAFNLITKTKKSNPVSFLNNRNISHNIFLCDNNIYFIYENNKIYLVDKDSLKFADSLALRLMLDLKNDNFALRDYWVDQSNIYLVYRNSTTGINNLVSLRPKTPSSVEHSETETPRSRAFLHAGKPYPLPAVSTVSADLHWNAQYSAQEAVLKVFDSMGNEIPNANVELQQTNPYSGTVTWDCGAYPTGVYFIQVTIGTEQKNVGVAVVR